MNINPLHAIDFYKADHRRQYPENTVEVYSNFTPRSSKLANVLPGLYENQVVFFGLQYFMMDFLQTTWNVNFFQAPKEQVVAKYKRRMDNSLGNNAIGIKHIAALHDLQYLPIRIKALPEGTLVPIGVPVLTIANTHPDFFWLTNYLETVMSCSLWKPITSATLAYEYRKLLTKYAVKTGTPLEFVPFQAHDFSCRGLSGIYDAALSAAGHMTSFVGTDTVSGIDLLEDYYHADSDKELVGCSVPATEHAVMCMGMQDGEFETFRRLIEDIYPTGIVSIVSDTWDFWQVVTEYMPALKDKIMARDGKVVLRPDSGDPVKIICGDPNAPVDSPEYKGAVECLWDVFGGTLTHNNYKMLDSHIGLIYGDSITLERAYQILTLLERKGFASGNIVLGVGSYTYQYVTRDTFGFAMKATSGVVSDQRREIHKNPKTDSGTKKSAKGLLRVDYNESGVITLYDQQTQAQELGGLLETVFVDGKILHYTSLSEVRSRILNYLSK